MAAMSNGLRPRYRPHGEVKVAGAKLAENHFAAGLSGTFA